MSSLSANIFGMIPRFWRQNYVYQVARTLSVRKLSLQTYKSGYSNFKLIYTPVRSFSEVKDSTAVEVPVKEILDKGFDGEESWDHHNFVPPDSTDPHIQALASANSVTEVFELFDKIEDLKPFHISQILTTLHILQKKYTTIHHEFQQQIQERFCEFNIKILNHEQFSSLMAKLEPLIDDMPLDEAAVNLNTLRKVGVPLSDPIQVKLYLRLIKNIDQLDLKCLSYFGAAMRYNLEDIDFDSELLPIILRVDELLDCCTEPEQLYQAAACLLKFKIEISNKMLTKIAEKFKCFVEAGKYSSARDISTLKKILTIVLANTHWFKNHWEYVDLLVNQHRGYVHSIEPKHLQYLYSVMTPTAYPVQLYKDCFERISYLISKGESYKGTSLTSNVMLLNQLLSTKNFAIPMNDIQTKFRTFLESDHITAGDIKTLYFIYKNSHLCSHKLLDKYFDKSFETVKHDPTELTVLSKRLRQFSSGKWGNFYRNKDIKMKILACLNQQQTKSLIKVDDNDKTIKEMSLELSQAIQAILLKQSNTSKDEQNNITENFLLFDVISMMSYFEKNVTYEEYCYKLFVDAFRATKDELNLFSVLSVSRSLLSMSPWVEFPEIVDTVEQFYINNLHLTKEISVRGGGYFATVCFHRNRCLKPELVDIIAQNICRELDLLNGHKIVTVCYNLAALQVFPKFLAKEIFSSEFMTKLDSEIQTENINPRYIKHLREDLMNLNRCMVLQYPEYKVPWFNQAYCIQNIDKIAFTPNTRIKREVYESLCSAVGDCEYVKMNSYSEYFNHIHFELGLDAQANLVNLNLDQNNVVKKIAIQAYDDTHYFRDTKKLRGEYKLNNLQLSLQGWQVLNISQFSWNSSILADSGAKKQFLQESIRAVSS